MSEPNYIKIDQSRLFKTFRELCEIPSQSRHEAEVASYIISRFEEMKIDYEIDNSATKTGSNVGNILAYLPHNKTSKFSNLKTRFSHTSNGQETPNSTDNAGKTYVFCAHMDTVAPTSATIKNGSSKMPIIETDTNFLTDGTAVLGADDKAGIAAMLEICELLRQRKRINDIYFLITTCEEIGLLGAKAFDTKNFLNTKLSNSQNNIFCYALDVSGPPGTIVTAAAGKVDWTAQIEGKAAHAGMAPEAGVSAIQIAADVISELPQGRIADGTTANTALIKGGRATNIIADTCQVSGEVRSHSIEQIVDVLAEIEETFNAKSRLLKGKTTFIPKREYLPYALKEDSIIVDIAKYTALQLELPINITQSNGGSDANVFNAAGLTTVALGTGYENIHSTDESMSKQELINLTSWILQIAQT